MYINMYFQLYVCVLSVVSVSKGDLALEKFGNGNQEFTNDIYKVSKIWFYNKIQLSLFHQQ